jgi:hypothetical protein
MTKILLFAGLSISLLVPASGVAVVVAAATSEPATRSPGEVRPPTQFEKAGLVAITKELEALDRVAAPGETAQILEARRISREARSWTVHFEAEPEWEELALATSALAALIADGLENPSAFPQDGYDRAVARVRLAQEHAPPLELDQPY